MPRRKEGTLLPLEVRVLEIAQQAHSKRTPMYGFALASALSEDGGKSLTGHGTLYKVLARLADAGLLETEWEDPDIAEAEHRPRRRLYRISSQGTTALSAAHKAPATTPHPITILRPVQQ
ncbi:helix-turn-helix transcriptional regulator [Arthrobacter sp. ISL-48]|uniref:PadR family transcriptional regulator n=1 Tax=Arthrobacter sp. ISL-48 TaxID=2819110 RepID=UPI001BE5A4A8|nr:helix-turn-helix transcriptional regulator [Arthrobacter sp. ISL-48]MBT2531344.1 helix-turn-helix transcriptional regulator [Arthrobacter sp. ISL-48]